MNRRGFFGVVIGLLTGHLTLPKPIPALTIERQLLSYNGCEFSPLWATDIRTHLDREVVIDKWIYRPKAQ